jgi:hypothetical protein
MAWKFSEFSELSEFLCERKFPKSDRRAQKIDWGLDADYGRLSALMFVSVEVEKSWHWGPYPLPGPHGLQRRIAF